MSTIQRKLDNVAESLIVDNRYYEREVRIALQFIENDNISSAKTELLVLIDRLRQDRGEDDKNSTRFNDSQDL